MAKRKEETPSRELDQATTSRRCARPNASGGRSESRRSSHDAQGAVSRREMIRRGVGAAVATPLLAATTAAQKKRRPAEKRKKAPLFFTPEEFALADELTELIIPADDHSPGARAAGVAAYIDFRLSESVDEEPRRLWREGLNLIETISMKMHSKRFLEASPDQRVALLTRISRNEMKPQAAEDRFFRELKSRAVRAYYTSKVGIHNELEYKGNTYLKEYAGYDAS